MPIITKKQMRSERIEFDALAKRTRLAFVIAGVVKTDQKEFQQTN